MLEPRIYSLRSDRALKAGPGGTHCRSRQCRPFNRLFDFSTILSIFRLFDFFSVRRRLGQPCSADGDGAGVHGFGCVPRRLHGVLLPPAGVHEPAVRTVSASYQQTSVLYRFKWMRAQAVISREGEDEIDRKSPSTCARRVVSPPTLPSPRLQTKIENYVYVMCARNIFSTNILCVVSFV